MTKAEILEIGRLPGSDQAQVPPADGGFSETSQRLKSAAIRTHQTGAWMPQGCRRVTA
jgi:hypothetical protein